MYLSGCLGRKVRNGGSLESLWIEEQTMESQVEGMPLALIQILDPLLAKIYQKGRINW